MSLSAGKTIRISFKATEDISKAFKSINCSSEPVKKTFNYMKVAVPAAMTIASAAVADFAVDCLKDFATFEKGMNKVFSLLPQYGAKQMDKLSADTLKFADKMKVMPNEVSNAMYEAFSAGVTDKEMFPFLNIAQKAAVGGVTDLTTSVDALSTVINTYGRDVITFQQASDIIFNTAKIGKTTFPEMAQFMYQVLPSANAAGVAFDQVGAALATMTAGGTPTMVATTKLRAVIDELSKSGTAASKTFKKVSGKTFPQFIKDGGNLQDALKLMEKQAKKSGLMVTDMFSSIEAGTGALQLTGKNTKMFTDSLDAMKNSAGATDEAYQRLNKGLARTVEKIQVKYELLKIKIGAKLAPYALKFLTDFEKKLNQLEKNGSIDRWINSAISGLKMIGSVVEFLANHLTMCKIALGLLITHFAIVKTASFCKEIGSAVKWLKDLQALPGPIGKLMTGCGKAFISFGNAMMYAAGAAGPFMVLVGAILAVVKGTEQLIAKVKKLHDLGYTTEQITGATTNAKVTGMPVYSALDTMEKTKTTGKKVKENAIGTTSASGGLSLVGERGMELVVGPKLGMLPQGSKVLNNDQTKRFVRGESSGKQVSINLPQIVINSAPEEDLITTIMRAIEQALRSSRELGGAAQYDF